LGQGEKKEFMAKNSIAASLLALTLFAGPAAFADGGPAEFTDLFKGPANVAIKNEVVKIDVGEKFVKVDCSCVFHNSGSACSMRIGFLDNGTKDVPQATFTTYDSWVDGKKVKTALIPQTDRNLFWQAKTVSFKGNSDCSIRDVYTLPRAAPVTTENGTCQQIHYAFRTAAFLCRPIERMEVTVNFAPNLVSNPIRPRFMYGDAMNWSSARPEIIYYYGPSPLVEINTLRFIGRNFNSQGVDDLHLYYGYTDLINKN
jgi:hypothetical protein